MLSYERVVGLSRICKGFEGQNQAVERCDGTMVGESDVVVVQWFGTEVPGSHPHGEDVDVFCDLVCSDLLELAIGIHHEPHELKRYRVAGIPWRALSSAGMLRVGLRHAGGSRLAFVLAGERCEVLRSHDDYIRYPAMVHTLEDRLDG